MTSEIHLDFSVLGFTLAPLVEWGLHESRAFVFQHTKQWVLNR